MNQIYISDMNRLIATIESDLKFKVQAIEQLEAQGKHQEAENLKGQVKGTRDTLNEFRQLRD
ncbi:hypothetical protein [Enterococcus phage TJE1]|uniref:Uncharacterized protein n=1 Tax=Enterococcus phage TJE1 TaxID=2951262 RepID=A0A976SXV9_9CAUD|nr:hypothetical protein [Enterococcus phage TJE1]